jgi:hypothetical protein
LRLRLDAARQLWREAILRFDERSQMSLLESMRIPAPDSQKLVMMLAAALLFTSLWLTWQLRRELVPAPTDPVVRAFQALQRKLAARGLARSTGEPAGEFAERVSMSRPDLAPAIRSLCREYNELRYGKSTHDIARVRLFRAAVRAFNP